MAVDPIIIDLQVLMENDQELDILNFHKSFPITCKAQVEAVERGTVALRVQPPGSVCLKDQETAILLSRGLPEAVRARIISFDIRSGRLLLSDFSFLGANFGERLIARVQPEEAINVEIEAGSRRITGALADVSLNGIGVYVPEPTFQRGELLLITLPLPEQQITLPGRVVNASTAPDGQTRLAIGFTRKAQEISVVMRYVVERRGEILNEVERLYASTYQAQAGSANDLRPIP